MNSDYQKSVPIKLALISDNHHRFRIVANCRSRDTIHRRNSIRRLALFSFVSWVNNSTPATIALANRCTSIALRPDAASLLLSTRVKNSSRATDWSTFRWPRSRKVCSRFGIEPTANSAIINSWVTTRSSSKSCLRCIFVTRKCRIQTEVSTKTWSIWRLLLGPSQDSRSTQPLTGWGRGSLMSPTQ